MRIGWLGGLLGVLALACGRGKPSVATRAEAYVTTRAPQLANGSLAILGDDLGDDVLEAILADPRVPALKDLSLGRNRLTAAAVRTIAASPKSAHLRLLALDINPVGDQGLVVLSKWFGLTTLEDLMVAHTGATSVGIRALASSPHLTSLKRATFGFQNVGDDGAIALAALPVREWMHVDSGQIGPAGARALLSAGHSTSLSLNNNPIGAGGLATLPAISPTLAGLAMQQTGLGAADAMALAALAAPALRSLDLEYNDLGDAGVRALVGAPWFAQLDALDVAYTRASEATYDALRAAWGAKNGLTAGDGRAAP